MGIGELLGLVFLFGYPWLLAKLVTSSFVVDFLSLIVVGPDAFDSRPPGLLTRLRSSRKNK